MLKPRYKNNMDDAMQLGYYAGDWFVFSPDDGQVYDMSHSWQRRVTLAPDEWWVISLVDVKDYTRFMEAARQLVPIHYRPRGEKERIFSASFTVLPEQAPLVMVVSHDISEFTHLKHTEQDRQTYITAFLAEASHLWESEQDESAVSSQLLALVMKAIPYNRANLLLLDEAHYRVTACYGYSSSLQASLRQAHYTPSAIQSLTPADLTQDRQAQSILSQSLIIKGEMFGLLNLEHTTPSNFTEAQRSNLQIMAQVMADILYHNRRMHILQRDSVAQERKNLARELHDSLSQTLFSAGMIAETLPTLLETNPQHAQHGLEQLVKMTKGALAELRSLMVELRPASLTELRLSTALSYLVDTYAIRTTAIIHADIDDQRYDHPEDVKVNVYRIVQEVMNNIIKHARAETIRLIYQQTANSVTLTIEDDGRGFEPSAITSSHLGLRFMRERAQQIGAILDIQSFAGKGTQVHLYWRGHDTTIQ